MLHDFDIWLLLDGAPNDPAPARYGRGPIEGSRARRSIATSAAIAAADRGVVIAPRSHAYRSIRIARAARRSCAVRTG
jgi:hypothetical protein